MSQAWKPVFKSLGVLSAGWFHEDVPNVVRLIDIGDKVGIGTITPNEKLTVIGNISASNHVYSTAGQLIAGVTIQEIDGAPNLTTIHTIKVSNGTLTDVSAGVATITTGGGGGTITVMEEDGTPTLTDITIIKVTNGTLAAGPLGTAIITTGGGSGGVVSLFDAVMASDVFR